MKSAIYFFSVLMPFVFAYDLHGQSYYNALSQSSLIQIPSFTGAAKKNKVSLCYNKQYDNDPVNTPGIANVFFSFDRLLNNQTTGIGGYLAFDKIKAIRAFDNYSVNSISPENKASHVTGAFIVSSKYTLPNLLAGRRSKYTFTPSLFLKFQYSDISDYGAYAFDLETLIFQYEHTQSLIFTGAVGTGLMINSKNFFVSIKISGEEGWHSNAIKTGEISFGKYEEERQEKKRYGLFSTEQCYSVGLTIPKKEKSKVKLILIGSIGKHLSHSPNEFIRKTRAFQNDRPVLAGTKLDYHAGNAMLRYKILLAGVSETSYYRYSVVSFLLGLNLDRVRIVNSISSQGYSLNATILFD